MNETLEYLQTFARFPFALRRFLTHRLTLEEAKQIVRERMEHREDNFLRIIEKSVYNYPRSVTHRRWRMWRARSGKMRIQF